MEKIDLTKCNNCRFRAKVDGKNDYGRICVENADTGLAFLRSDVENDYIATWHCDDPTIEGICGRKVTDFEIAPRDPETYMDWQVGDRVCDNEHRNASREVIFRSGELVVMKTDANTACSNYTCDELFGCGYRLVLTDIEQQIIGEKKKYEPQDGDIVYVKAGYEHIAIFKKEVGEDMYVYANWNMSFSVSKIIIDDSRPFCCIHDLREIRPTTEREKKILIDQLAKEGKRWNAEKKVVEDIPKPYEFKKGEPVLVRDNGCVWKIGVFTKMRADYFQYGAMTNGLDECGYRFCIPYNERTMHLLGTTEDYKEEQL